MNKPGRMKDKIVTLLFLIAGAASLDYHNLMVDEISGELLKPSNWSEAKVLTVQQLRLSVRRNLFTISHWSIFFFNMKSRLILADQLEVSKYNK